MNFYNDEENEKKAGAPVLPRAASPFKKTSAFGKTPLFSRAAGGIMDRLKNLSRRDMALVGLGLSVLVMVPVAEYMMSQPSTDNVLEGGWGGKEKLGSMPYEPGINGLSQGSSDGSGEVITPLSSRDPMSLILGSQSAQPAVAAPVYTPPASSMRDAMRDAGREAFSAATKSAGAPTVIPKMAAGLRGMSSFFGGGESSRTQGSLGGGKIIDDARSASSKAAKRSMVGPVAIAGYKGVASTPNSASKGAFEKLRAAADKSAGNFSGGSAMNSLDKAAADALEIGKGGGGMGAGGDSDKTGKTSGNSVKGYEHSRSGETLAEMAAKQRMQKALDWEFYKKYEIPKQIMNAIVGAVSGVIGEFIKSNLTTALGMDPPPPAKCWNPAVCPDGNSCGAQAVTYLGANWWTLGKKMTDLCSIGGSPVAFKTVVGKESASTSSEVCLCGKGSAPSSGGAPAAGAAGGAGGAGGGPGDSVVSTPAQHSAAAVESLKDYDGILRDIVTMVAEVEASPRKATDNLKGVVGGFQNLTPKARETLNKLGNLNSAAETELDTFNTSLASSQGKMAGVKPQYDTFTTQLEAFKTDLAANTVKMEVKGGIERTLPAGTKTKIEDLIKQWQDTGVTFYSSAEGNLEAQRRWAGAFSSQIPLIRGGITDMTGKQNTIDGLVSQIDGAEGTPLEKLKKISGQLKDVQESTATAKNAGGADQIPLKLTAEGQRGLDWAKLWERQHDMDATKVAEAEGSEFKQWVLSISAAKADTAPVTPTKPGNFVNNQMRSTQLKSAIKGQQPNFKSIDDNLTKTTAAIEAIRKALLGYGIKPSYFPGAAGGTAGGAPEVPVSTGTAGAGNGAGGGTNNPPAVPVVQQGPRVNHAITRGDETLSRIQGQAGALQSIPGNSSYQGYRDSANQAVRKADTALVTMKAAQARIDSPTATAAEKTAAQAEFAAAKREFDTQIGAATSNITTAQNMVPTALQPLPVQPLQPRDEVSAAERAKAEANVNTIGRCVTYGVGTANGAIRCSVNQSKRITTAATHANQLFTTPLTPSKVSGIRSQAESACVEISSCRSDIFASIGCRSIR